MKSIFIILLFLSSLFAAKIEFEVLGSGGPELDRRASTSYLLWIDGEAKLIVDMGSGSMLRFEESNAKIETLRAVVLTHLHIDHSVDLPAFMKAGFFSSRSESLDIIAPDGNDYFPSSSEFLNALFGKNGAYKYMNDILSEQSDSFQIVPIDIKETTTRRYKEFTLNFIRVHHGIVPALALQIIVDGKSIVISGDTNNEEGRLEALCRDADLFVAHHAVPQSANVYAKELHMTPEIIGDIANKAKVKKVLLTHRMKRTIGDESESLEIIKSSYKGEVVFAEDRMKFSL
jgi:ribonuclease BN (tRNA processing enzyme)